MLDVWDATAAGPVWARAEGGAGGEEEEETEGCGCGDGEWEWDAVGDARGGVRMGLVRGRLIEVESTWR